ncbi:MAG: hypothetical protein RR649_03625, partial [Carnobacterium sp.]
GITYVSWPTYDESFLAQDEIEVVFQLNGKLRAKAKAPKEIKKEELEELAMSNEKMKEALVGKTIRKVIVVPGRLVNIVAN